MIGNSTLAERFDAATDQNFHFSDADSWGIPLDTLRVQTEKYAYQDRDRGRRDPADGPDPGRAQGQVHRHGRAIRRSRPPSSTRARSTSAARGWRRDLRSRLLTVAGHRDRAGPHRHELADVPLQRHARTPSPEPRSAGRAIPVSEEWDRPRRPVLDLLRRHATSRRRRRSGWRTRAGYRSPCPTTWR